MGLTEDNSKNPDKSNNRDLGVITDLTFKDEFLAQIAKNFTKSPIKTNIISIVIGLMFGVMIATIICMIIYNQKIEEILLEKENGGIVIIQSIKSLFLRR